MSLARHTLAACLLGWLASGPAAAQGFGADRFFAETTETEAERHSTTYDGSLTSTTFYYRESGDAAPSPSMGGEDPFTASPVDRIFTDLRTQLDARHISGSKTDFRADLRARLTTTTYTQTAGAVDPERNVPYQSGIHYGNEIDVRELYFRHRGSAVDFAVGRQYSLELAATKFDGLKIEGSSSKQWKYILFGGLYPSRISRDLRDDYPVADADPITPGYQLGGGRIFPLTGGAGLAYRYTDVYGAFGLVGVLPRADDGETGIAEPTRLFATTNGYWRASQSVDFYHYVVADAAGSSGSGLTNLTLGVNFQPTKTVRAYVNISRIDTDTLNVIAQTKLQDPDSMPGTGVQNTAENNVEVQRIAQDLARIGLSGNFSNRVELSTSASLRQRGELRVEPVNGNPNDPTDDLVFPAAQAADITIALVDRDSLGGMRLGLSGTSSFGVGNASLYRSRAYLLRLDTSKELADGQAVLEGAVTYLNSADDNRGTQCDFTTLGVSSCYGAATVQSITAAGLLFYRFRPDWFLVTNVNIGQQMSSAADAMGAPVTQPNVLTLGFLFRLSYRF